LIVRGKEVATWGNVPDDELWTAVSAQFVSIDLQDDPCSWDLDEFISIFWPEEWDEKVNHD
jgi:hypothetical protein